MKGGVENGFYDLFIEFLSKKKNISVQMSAGEFATVFQEEVSFAPLLDRTGLPKDRSADH